MGMSIEWCDSADAGSAQPETVVTLLRQLGVRNASGTEIANVLRAWVRDNVPNTELRLSIRRNGYGSILDQRFGRQPRRGAGLARRDTAWVSAEFARLSE